MKTLLCSLVLLLGCAAPTGDSVPVMVGGTADVDACPSIGSIDNDGAIAFRAGPGNEYRRIATLAGGDYAYLCSVSPDGAWSGVVLVKDGADCGVSSPIHVAEPYKGPCLSGWVPTRWISPAAG